MQLAVRLDAGSANHAGTPFTLAIKYADNSETHCDATMNGTENSGTYETSNCTGSTGMSASGSQAHFNTGGVGTYTYTGTGLQLCRASGTCLEYH